MQEKKLWGFGDVKFMGAIGLYFGVSVIAEISLLAFLVAAIVSVAVLLFRLIRKNKDEYVPFGPFLVFGAIVMILVKDGTVFRYFIGFCKILSDKLIEFFH